MHCETANRRREVATTIKRQIGVGVLMAVGASDFTAHTNREGQPGLAFVARVIPDGQSRPRRMHVSVTLNAEDYYDILVTYQRHGSLEMTTHREWCGIDCDNLGRTLLSLDDVL